MALNSNSSFYHECLEWDGLLIDENSPEFECCLCFKDIKKEELMNYLYESKDILSISIDNIKKVMSNLEQLINEHPYHNVWLNNQDSNLDS